MTPNDSEYIVAVAIRLGLTAGDLILTLPAPNRHHHVLHKFYQWRDSRLTGSAEGCFPMTQGFLTNRGRFVDRFEAYKIQTGENADKELYSEDLW